MSPTRYSAESRSVTVRAGPRDGPRDNLLIAINRSLRVQVERTVYKYISESVSAPPRVNAERKECIKYLVVDV